MNPLRLWRSSLAARLSLVYGLISVVAVGALGLAVYLGTARYLLGQAQDDLDALADFYAAYTAAAAPDEIRLTALAPQIAGFFAPQSGYNVRLFNARDGNLLAATRDIGRLPSSTARVALQSGRTQPLLIASYDRPNRLYAARQAGDGETPLAVIEVSRDAGELYAFLHTLRLILIAAGGLALLLSLVASLLLARQMTRPLRQMVAATRDIAAGDFDRRLPAPTEDEIGRLATSVNQMAADLARLEAARRDFIAKVSHDLRTPLTAIKGFVVNLQDSAPAEMQPALSTMDEQTDRLIRLVDDLLTLSRLQRGVLRLQVADTDILDVIGAAAAIARPKADRLGIVLDLDLPAGLLALPADADRLQQVLINLLDNAIQTTPPGGTIRVAAARQQEDVAVTIADQGPGIPPQEAARAFEPYTSGKKSGTGLGLAIAREIVEAHGGRIWLRPCPAGGSEAGFTLPVTEP